jgi:hypothetical protein
MYLLLHFCSHLARPWAAPLLSTPLQLRLPQPPAGQCFAGFCNTCIYSLNGCCLAACVLCAGTLLGHGQPQCCQHRCGCGCHRCPRGSALLLSAMCLSPLHCSAFCFCRDVARPWAAPLLSTPLQLRLPPLPPGQCFADCYELVLLIDQREQYGRYAAGARPLGRTGVLCAYSVSRCACVWVKGFVSWVLCRRGNNV